MRHPTPDGPGCPLSRGLGVHAEPLVIGFTPEQKQLLAAIDQHTASDGRILWDDAEVMDFFLTSTRNILAAEAAAGVKHHVALSVVGADRLPESGYLRAKVAQEETVKAGLVPYTILRASQFFEFIGRIADSSSDGGTVRLAPVFVQPESADDVAAALAEVAVSEPMNSIVELAGPEQFRLDELVRRVLRANNDPRPVTADVHARYFGAELADHSLTPGSNARIAGTRFEDWLSRSMSG